MSKKTIEGNNLFGEKRGYTFNILGAEKGLEIFHKFAPKFFNFIDDEIGGLSIKSVLGKFNNSDVLSLDDVKQLATDLLAGCEVVIDDEIHEVGETGIGDFAAGDPLELYTAIFYALRANFPKYIDPLFKGVDDGSTPKATDPKSKK